jgi:hypothetical protein
MLIIIKLDLLNVNFISQISKGVEQFDHGPSIYLFLWYTYIPDISATPVLCYFYLCEFSFLWTSFQFFYRAFSWIYFYTQGVTTLNPRTKSSKFWWDRNTKLYRSTISLIQVKPNVLYFIWKYGMSPLWSFFNHRFVYVI